ncbi:MAG TPA: prepilin-type N-terminal cleavage/methylation domain-containing protein [Prosthecobacter sp.]|nr:prepilin-type N-terminal cleavage/methylation domain-containing protein [Prosthecobacter sp.]HRK15213.1 prepilin-type N-terminal cleavage/methylation domain-containing protein [Prosthecobacter sp.]
MFAPQGFTLLEVIMALGLITLILGGVYGIADGSLRLGASMSRARLMETRVSHFTMTWRDYLENLPPGIRLSAGLEKGARGSAGALLIEAGPAPFAWSQALALADAVEFAVVRGDREKSLTLLVRHLKRLEKPTPLENYQLMAELPLLQNLKTFRASYYDAGEKKWFASWDPDKRPAPPLFMRLNFAFLDDPREHELVFWIANDLKTVMNVNSSQEGLGNHEWTRMNTNQKRQRAALAGYGMPTLSLARTLHTTEALPRPHTIRVHSCPFVVPLLLQISNFELRTSNLPV